MQGKKKLTITSIVIVLCALMAAIIIFQGHPQEAFAANDKSNANSLVVYKTDQNKRPLNGAEFTLYDAFTDEAVEVKTTGGNDGTATFTNLKNGAYILKETKLPHPNTGYHYEKGSDYEVIVSDGYVTTHELKSDNVRSERSAANVVAEGKSATQAQENRSLQSVAGSCVESVTGVEMYPVMPDSQGNPIPTGTPGEVQVTGNQALSYSSKIKIKDGAKAGQSFQLRMSKNLNPGNLDLHYHPSQIYFQGHLIAFATYDKPSRTITYTLTKIVESLHDVEFTLDLSGIGPCPDVIKPNVNNSVSIDIIDGDKQWAGGITKDFYFNYGTKDIDAGFSYSYIDYENNEVMLCAFVNRGDEFKMNKPISMNIFNKAPDEENSAIYFSDPSKIKVDVYEYFGTATYRMEHMPISFPRQIVEKQYVTSEKHYTGSDSELQIGKPDRFNIQGGGTLNDSTMLTIPFKHARPRSGYVVFITVPFKGDAPLDATMITVRNRNAAKHDFITVKRDHIAESTAASAKWKPGKVTVVNKKVKNPDSGKIVITKKDAETKHILPGATFQIMSADGKRPLSDPAKVDSNGQLVCENLPFGTFMLKEIEAPEGYELNQELIPIVIKEKASHHPSDGTLISLDKDLGTKEDKYADWSYKTYIKQGNSWHEGKSLSGTQKASVNTHLIEVDPIDKTYKAVVTITPDKPFQEPMEMEFQVPGAKVVSAVMDNEDYTRYLHIPDEGKDKISFGSYTANKRSITLTLNGSYKGDTVQVNPSITNKRNVVEKLMPNGRDWYTFTGYENTFKSGFSMQDERFKGPEKVPENIITDDYEVIYGGVNNAEITVYNKKKSGQVKVLKVDEANQALAGAKFELQVKGNDGSFTKFEKKGLVNPQEVNPNTGEALWGDIPFGTYRLVEVQSPSGYVNENPIGEEFVVDGNHQSIEQVVINKSNEIIFKKAAINPQVQGGIEYLKGAEFELRLKGSNEVAKDALGSDLRTSSKEDGTIKFSNLPAGEYNLYETKAPTGYVKKDGALRNFKIDQSGKVVDLNNNGGPEDEDLEKITNEKLPEIPSTGSFGGLGLTVAGSLLISGASLGILKSKDFE